MPIDDFRQKVNKLPLPVKEIMLSDKTLDTAKYRLSLEQQGKIAQITGKALIKDIPLNELVNHLKSQVNLDLETTKSLAFDIIQKFFLPIKKYFPDAEELMRRLKSNQAQSPDRNIVDLKNQ